MEITQAFVLVFKIAIALTLFGVGLRTTPGDLGYLLRRPSLLVRSLLAMSVITPLVAIALARGLRIGPAASIALIAGALAPGLPNVPTTGGAAGGNVAFACSLMVVSALLCVATVPLWLLGLNRAFGLEVEVGLEALVRVLVLSQLTPVVAGVALRALAPRWAERIEAPISKLANALMPGLALVIVAAGFQSLAALPWVALVAMVLAAGIGLAVGHVLGGPNPRDRTVLALASATRFPALALLIATTVYPAAQAPPAIIAYVVIAVLIAVPYLRWRRRVHGGAGSERMGGQELAPSGPAPRPA